MGEVASFRDDQEALFQKDKASKAAVDTGGEFLAVTRAEVDQVQTDYAANKAKTVDFVVNKVLDVPTELSETQKMVLSNVREESPSKTPQPAVAAPPKVAEP